MIKLQNFTLVGLFLALIQLSYEQNCDPFGEIIYQGEFYTSSRDTDDYLTIGINTKDECQSLRLELFDKSSAQTVKQYVQPFKVQKIDGSVFQQDPNIHYVIYTHFYKIPNLKENKIYEYQLEDSTKLKSFKVPRVSYPAKKEENNKDKFTGNHIIVHGDFDANVQEVSLTDVAKNGNWGQYTHDYLKSLSEIPQEQNEIDYLMFLGDYVYDIKDEEYQRGQRFFEKTSQYYGHFSNIITLGNHESGDTQEGYQYRFAKDYFMLPNHSESQNFRYITDLVYAQVVNIDLKHFWYYDEDKEEQQLQYIKQQLQEVNERRTKEKPFVIVISHYPYYCEDECDPKYPNFVEVEKILIEYKVDLYLSGHVHNYQRYYPVQQKTMGNWTYNNDEEQRENTFIDADAPIYIIEGTGGNSYYFQMEKYPENEFIAVQSSGKPAVGKLSVFNETHMRYQHINTHSDNSGQILDECWIIKSHDEETKKQSEKTNSTVLIIIIISVSVVVIIIMAVAGLYNVKKRQHSKLLPMEDKKENVTELQQDNMVSNNNLTIQK